MSQVKCFSLCFWFRLGAIRVLTAWQIPVFFSLVLIIAPKLTEEIQCYILLPELNRINRGESLDFHWYPEVQGLWYSLQLSMFYINIVAKCMVLQKQSRCILVFALFMKFEYKVVQILEQFMFII